MSISSSKSNKYLNTKRNLSTIDTNDDISKIPLLNKGPWTEKEDQLIIKWVQKYGACNWTKCSEYMKGRSGKQCREHWNNSLNPDLIKGQWTSEEDLLIMIFYKKYGGSWKKIIPIFEKRTENSIKNRFFSQLRKLASKLLQSKRRENGLEDLKKILPQATEMAKQKYFAEKKMNEKEFDEYVIRIDKAVKNRKKGYKFINLDSIRNEKNINNKKNDINIIETDEEYEFEKKENLETNKKRKRGRKKKLENKKTVEKIFNNDEESIKEKIIPIEEIIKPIIVES